MSCDVGKVTEGLENEQRLTNFAQRLYNTEPMALLPFQRNSYSGFLRSEKNPSTPAKFEPANLGFSGEYDNHGTTAYLVIDKNASADITNISKKLNM